MVRITDLVVLPVSRQAINWAVTTATQKVIQTDRGFVRRGLAQILQNTFQGDLAKNALIEWLKFGGIANNRIWEFDRVRPHFRSWNRLGYQLKVTKSDGHEVTIDVNSSMPHQNETDRDIIDRYDVKVTAGSSRNNLRDPSALRSEVFVQIYVRPRVGMVEETPNRIRDALLAQEMSATRRLLQVSQAYGANILTGFSWATRQDVARFKRRFERRGQRTTWSFWRRIYWRCPIKSSRPMRTLIQYFT